MTAALLAAAAAWAVVRPRAANDTTRQGRRDPGQFPGGFVALAALAAALSSTATVGTPIPWALGVVGVTTAWGAHRLWSRRDQARAAEQTRGRVLECCELLASELVSGQPPESALRAAAEEWTDLVAVAQTASYGGDVPAALRRASSVPGAADLRLVAAAWHVSHRTGLGLADALSRVAASLRDARATERLVTGELASARATARLVAALPVVGLVIGMGSGGDPLGFLLTTFPGVVCLAAGVGLVLAGLTWIERIAASVVR
jgi:tight adherence protein B